jgi:hypothetical protein
MNFAASERGQASPPATSEASLPLTPFRCRDITPRNFKSVTYVVDEYSRLRIPSKRA